MKCIKLALAQTAATIAAVAVGAQALAHTSVHYENWRDPVQHLFGNGFYSISEDMGENWELVGPVNPQNTPSGPMWEFLQRPLEYHLFRHGRHLVSHDTGVTWLFFRCEADPFIRYREMMPIWDLGALPTAGVDGRGNPRVSCDGGITWE
ncbi:hypothetical protein THASP1DRAFT_33453 [Thamnocephalis sphaerospora]|uniref:Glycosyl hydrolase n=1 Tax=Thamnocephalis sphaerospora TaxID=78915 RepID=A0A4P9XGH7_9FUNG|nr:hypothetical protein THASP1DRAFT_33453 [Thamnocephalis sphaerospora]|eukprot:RKP04745.1 hypothetical protein THASP1DRAFT_33453 [Thamnocephalis sphaerospora]